MIGVNYKITGNNLQLVAVELGAGEKVYGETGTMVYMNANKNMEVKMKGGLLKAIGRKFAGETMFLTEFTPTDGEGLVAFGGNTPGTIKPIELGAGREFIVQKNAFLCAEDSVDLKGGISGFLLNTLHQTHLSTSFKSKMRR